MLHRHTIDLMKLNSTPRVNGEGALATVLDKSTAFVRRFATTACNVGKLHMLRRYLCVALNKRGKPP